MAGDRYGRLLELADEVEHRASQFEAAVRENTDFHHRLLKYEQLFRAVDEAGRALRAYGHEQARQKDGGQA